MLEPVLRATIIMDQDQLRHNILAVLPTDPLFISHSTSPKPHWSVTPDRFLRRNNLIYIPDSSDLLLRFTLSSIFTFLSLLSFYIYFTRQRGHSLSLLSFYCYISDSLLFVFMYNHLCALHYLNHHNNSLYTS